MMQLQVFGPSAIHSLVPLAARKHRHSDEIWGKVVLDSLAPVVAARLSVLAPAFLARRARFACAFLCTRARIAGLSSGCVC
jgi:hypothetical protein